MRSCSLRGRQERGEAWESVVKGDASVASSDILVGVAVVAADSISFLLRIQDQGL